ncbi:MAG TPA: SprT-like domain-containing protein [Solirubrobacterales bacterium]|nr:SprT-like domain-containing protein [Solirubrobacterales bacterium]
MPKLRRRRPPPPAPKPRPRSYYLVAGVALAEEMDRLRALPVFADGPLAARRPQLKVRRAARRPNRLGFAVPAEFRLSVTAYPGIRPGDVLETLLHELVHLHVGRAREAHGWHGPTFKRVLGRAMRQAYGVAIPTPRATLHGTYAEAIEAQLRETAKRHPQDALLRSRG